MPTQLSIRERLIRVIHDAGSAIPRRELVRRFDGSRRSQANAEVSNMLNENVLALVGRGVRGDPVRLVFSGGYSGQRCKLCGQTIPEKKS